MNLKAGDLEEGFVPRYFVRERISAAAKHMRIEVRADGQVWLILPRYCPRRAANEFLDGRSDWIRRKLAEFDQRRRQAKPIQALRWDGNDRVPLRGVPTALSVMPSRLARPIVRITDGITIFCSTATSHNAAALSELLRDALRKLARADARRLLDIEAARLAVEYSGPRIADQKSLWGSCTLDGRISLNWRLLLAPEAVFRYVAVHELCHRRHHDHSRRFWQLVERQMPDFEMHRAWLRRHGTVLHGFLPRGSEPAPNFLLTQNDI